MILGIDIGGANLKYASLGGEAYSVEFPLWKRPNDLCAQLVSDIGRFNAVDAVVATMTGELADCFLDRAVGVGHLVDQLQRSTELLGLSPPLFYAVDGRFHSARDAKKQVDLIAAANWHALASFVAQTLVPDGLLIDVGSTTCDIIPFRAGAAATQSQTDYERLVEGSLVYLGGQRTPICAVIDRLQWKGEVVPVMREVFATMDDVRLLLEFQESDSTNCETADGAPRDLFHASNRVARMIGLDHRSVSLAQAKELASQIHSAARELLQASVERFGPVKNVVVSGHAMDLVSVPQESTVLFLEEQLGKSLSRCAPAYAIAKLHSKGPLR